MSNKNPTNNPYQGLTRAQVLDTMRQLLVQETINHFRMGLLYIYVVDSKLLEGTEYKNASDFFSSNIEEVSRSALAAYGAVARDFSEEVCVRFGTTRLQLLLTYKKAAQIELNHDDPGGTFILVPGEKGEVAPKLFSHCGVDDLRRALAHLRTTTGPNPIPAEDRAHYDQYREGVTSRFPKGSPVRVLLRNHQGKGLITFKDIPIPEMRTLIEALLEQLYPVRQMPQEGQGAHVS